jgi:DNA-binding winged helix-turn-helix (wHTH) protein/tetratricopeptide (TPR) repeat protein
MPPSSQLVFPPFQLNLAAEQLWHGENLVALRRKPFAVLRYLAEHPGRVVTQDELRKAVWANTHVSEAILRVNIREVRAALGDDAGVPRLIETIPRRGYRFLAQVQRAILGSDLQSGQLIPLAYPQPILVGRKTELLQLNQWMSQAAEGRCQVVFTVGEAGIGKSSLISTFLEQAAAENELWIGRGQCVDYQGPSEPYLPLLDLLGWLCHSPDGAKAIEILRRHAPTWLAQMPGLISESEFEALQVKVGGVGQERMLREMAEALERMSVWRPMAVVLEDLHWSDPSTLAWLDFFARRRRTARVLVIGTFRPAAALAADHPLRVIARELPGRYCYEINLPPLSVSEVTDYLTRRAAVHGDDQAKLLEIGSAIHQRTEGNPLFVVNVVDTLLSDVKSSAGAFVQSLAQLQTLVSNSSQAVAAIGEIIMQQFSRLNGSDQRLIEIASVAGMQFSTAAVAAGAQWSLVEVEESCAALANRMSFLERSGDSEWPDGTVAARFRFRHSLYREVIYGRITPVRRSQFHQRIGERIEDAYQQNVGEVSTELALHFDQARDADRALRYRELAAQRAWQRAAMREAVEHLRAALVIVGRLPEGAPRNRHELELNVGLAAALQNGQGWGATDVERTYAIIEALCKELDDPQQVFKAGMSLWGFAVGRGKWREAYARAEQNNQLAESMGNPAHVARAQRAAGHSLFFLGRFNEARVQLERAIALNATLPGQLKTVSYTRNVTSDAAYALSWTLEILGYSEKALETARLALRTVEEGAHLPDLTSVTCYNAVLHWLRRDWPALETWGRRSVTLAAENGVPFIHAFGGVLQGVGIAEQGHPKSGLNLIRQGITACRTLGTLSALSAALLGLAQACKCAGAISEGLEALEEAFDFAKANSEHVWEAELYRTQGELLLDPGYSMRRATRTKREKQAEECFLTAIEMARNQGAPKWELRATTSLGLLWQQRDGHREQACNLLKNACKAITEGDKSSDLSSAKAVLLQLSARR